MHIKYVKLDFRYRLLTGNIVDTLVESRRTGFRIETVVRLLEELVTEGVATLNETYQVNNWRNQWLTVRTYRSVDTATADANSGGSVAGTAAV